MFIWTISDALWVVSVGIFAICAFAMWLDRAIKQWRCKHDGGAGETQACDAICHKCGKNLGFIGNHRKPHSSIDRKA